MSEIREQIRARVLVSGRVQGVFYRASTAEEAQKAGVYGWICNCPDGRVEAILEGEEEAVLQVAKFMRQGPPMAEVEHCEVDLHEYTGEFSTFEIRRS